MFGVVLLRSALIWGPFAASCNDLGVLLLRSAWIWGRFAAFCNDMGVLLPRSALIWGHFAAFCVDFCQFAAFCIDVGPFCYVLHRSCVNLLRSALITRQNVTFCIGLGFIL